MGSKSKQTDRYSERGSTELIVMGLLAALIIVLAIPLLTDIGEVTEANFGDLLTEMSDGTVGF